MTDALRHDEVQLAVGDLLIRARGVRERVTGEVRLRRQAVLPQERDDLCAGVLRADAALGGRARDNGHANGHAAAVRHGVVTAFFDRVAERVAEVQQLAAAAVELIGRDEVALHADTRRDDVLHLRADRGRTQLGKERFAAQHGVFDDLGTAVAVFLRREGVQRVRVAEHKARLIEAADLIFAAREVHGRLAADGGIHGGQQRRRHLHERDAALVRRGGKAREVAGHAAAERDDQVAAAQAVRGQKVQQRRVGGERLAALAAGIRKRHGAKARARERRREPRGVQPRNGLPRDDGCCAARAEHLRDLRARIVEQARLHEHVIIARGGHMDGRHRPSTSSLRRRPSSSRRVSAGRSSRTIASRYSPRCAMKMSSS